MRDASRIWDAALGQLRLGMNRANYDSYLAATFATGYDGSELTVAVPNPIIRETLERRFQPAMMRALLDVVGHQVGVRLVNGTARATVPTTNGGLFDDDDDRSPNGHSDLNGAASRRRKQPRPLMSTPLNPRLTFESFIVGSSNRLAHAASLAVADQPGQSYNPLFLYGGVGLGKTHLLHAIGQRVVTAGKDIVYVSSETFTNELIEAIRFQRMDEFRGRYRHCDALLIDDIQFIADKERTQEEFFHTFNAVHESGGQLVLTSDRAPKLIPTLEERLRSRFEMGLLADVQPPDLETRIAILRAKCNGRLRLPDDVLELIAHKVQTNIRELEGSLNRLSAHAYMHNQTITVEIAEQALTEIAAGKATPSADRIIETVATHFAVEVDELRAKTRLQRIVTPRHVAMYLLREDARLSMPMIGQLLGGRDHTSVLHACEKVRNGVRGLGSLRDDVAAIRDALRS
jgi:chromosomal replication initiator protein